MSATVILCPCGATSAATCAYPELAADPDERPTGCIGPPSAAPSRSAPADGPFLTPYSQIRRKRMEWLVPGRIPLGLVTILMGEPGLGKSLYSLQLAAGLSEAGMASIVLTGEDSQEQTIRPRLDACEANLDLVHAAGINNDGHDRGVGLPSDIDALDDLIGRAGARLVVVDPIVVFLDGKIDSHKDASVRQALGPLHRLAETHGCAILAIHHVNKGQGSDWYRRLSGSGGFGGAARSVLVFGRDPDDPDGERGRRRVLAVAKSNNDELADSQTWEIVPILIPAAGLDPEVNTARLDYIGESPHDHRALLDAGDPDERSALEDAAEFLAQALADGPRLQKEIEGEARKDGHADKTLRRAKKKLRVVSEKKGMHGPWNWALPEDGQPADTTAGGNAWPPSKNPPNDAVSEASGAAENSEGGPVSKTATFGTFTPQLLEDR